MRVRNEKEKEKEKGKEKVTSAVLHPGGVGAEGPQDGDVRTLALALALALLLRFHNSEKSARDLAPNCRLFVLLGLARLNGARGVMAARPVQGVLKRYAPPAASRRACSLPRDRR